MVACFNFKRVFFEQTATLRDCDSGDCKIFCWKLDLSFRHTGVKLHIRDSKILADLLQRE